MKQKRNLLQEEVKSTLVSRLLQQHDNAAIRHGVMNAPLHSPLPVCTRAAWPGKFLHIEQGTRDLGTHLVRRRSLFDSFAYC